MPPVHARYRTEFEEVKFVAHGGFGYVVMVWAFQQLLLASYDGWDTGKEQT